MYFKRSGSAVLWILLVMFYCARAWAVEVPGLFNLDIVARSEATADRDIALKQALFAVLERIVIADDIAQLPPVQQMLKNAEHYVKQLQYATLPVDDYADTDAKLLKVQFDEDQILDVLSKNQVGVWSEIRPETLVWLTVDYADGIGKQYYNAEAHQDLAATLEQVAQLKGLPVIYPLLDIEEQQKVSVNDIISTDSRNLLAASARYDMTSILAGRLIKKGSCWLSDWQFYFDNKIKQASSPCLPLKAAVSSGFKTAYDVLSAYYGVKPEPAK